MNLTYTHFTYLFFKYLNQPFVRELWFVNVSLHVVYGDTDLCCLHCAAYSW